MGLRRKLEVTLNFRSCVYLSGLLGLSSGIVVGIVSAVLTAIDGKWVDAGLTLLLVAPLSALSFAFSAAIGFPIYVYLSGRTAAARTLEGTFDEITEARN